MAALDDAIQAVVNAVDALESVQAADVPVTVVDPVRKAVEDVLSGEGWTAPVPEAPADAETPAEAPAELPSEPTE